MTDSADDKEWRIQKARWIKGQPLKFQPYVRWSETWDHDHCAACWATFAEFDGPDIQHEGYATTDTYPRGARYEWVCSACFDDLKDDMQWSAVGD
jgi:hypothetical protein